MAYQRNYKKHDEYTTPPSAWEAINHLIPEGSKVWMPFYCDGECGKTMRGLGHPVHHRPDEDFFDTTPRVTRNSKWVVVDNPPFSVTKEVLKRLVSLGMPFILIMPTGRLVTKYFREIFDGVERPQIIIPNKRIKFQKQVGGDWHGGCKPTGKPMVMDCYYYCWKIGLKDDMTYL